MRLTELAEDEHRCQRCGMPMQTRMVQSVVPTLMRRGEIASATILRQIVWTCPAHHSSTDHDANGRFGAGSGGGDSGSSGGGGKGAKAAAKAEAKKNAERVQALADELSAKYPDTHFDFTGTHPDVMEGVVKHLDTLMTKYPEVGKSIAYIGTGKDAPPLYGMDWTQNAKGFANMKAVRGRNPPYLVMNINPSYFGNPTLARSMSQDMERSQWFAPGSGKGGMEYIVTHEFGHAVDFYLEGAGQRMKARASSDVATDIWQFKGNNEAAGNQVSRYAQTNQQEQFAEAFASLHFSPPSQQASYTKKPSKFLEKTLPNGSSATWKPMK